MKRIYFTAFAIFISASLLLAQKQEIRDIDITLHLSDKGSVTFDEFWDINTGPKITEWYLVRENLGDIIIPNLTVLDGETGDKLEDIGEWDRNQFRNMMRIDQPLNTSVVRMGDVTSKMMAPAYMPRRLPPMI